jgi:transposase-like protein
VGALLRREGLYSSLLATWRRQDEQGALKALSLPRGRRPAQSKASQELIRLEKENARLKEELRKSNLIIDVQKKISALLSQASDES